MTICYGPETKDARGAGPPNCGRIDVVVTRFFLILFLAAAGTVSAADALLSPADFTRNFVQTLRTSAPNYTVTAKRDLQVVLQEPAEGRETTIFLYEAYNEYRRTPDGEDRIIRKYFAGLVAPQDAIRKVDRKRVVPIVKPRAWLDEVRTAAQAKGAVGVPEIVADDLNDQLMIVYAEDNPNTLRYMRPEQLGELRIKREELRGVAVANLKAILPKIEVRAGPLVTMVKSGGNYEACLLLVDDFWTGDKIKVDGEIVVAIPARDRLLITGSKNAPGLAKMRELTARAMAESSQRLTDTLFVYRGGRFEAFKD